MPSTLPTTAASSWSPPPATISPACRSPKSIVFPARYHRVLAACGVMARRPRLCRPQLRHHAGQLRAGEQDEDGARRLHAERAVGRDRLRQHRRHGRRRHVGGDAADRRRRSALARRALGHREELFAAVDARRGGAARAVLQGGASRRRKMERRRDAGEDRPGRGQGRCRAGGDAAAARASCASCRRPRPRGPGSTCARRRRQPAAPRAGACSGDACWRWS